MIEPTEEEREIARTVMLNTRDNNCKITPGAINTSASLIAANRHAAEVAARKDEREKVLQQAAAICLNDSTIEGEHNMEIHNRILDLNPKEPTQ